jgi:hypothetical protein
MRRVSEVTITEAQFEKDGFPRTLVDPVFYAVGYGLMIATLVTVTVIAAGILFLLARVLFLHV